AGANLEQMAQLAHPRQREHEVAAEAAEENVRERRLLALVPAGVDVEQKLPRRAVLVVVVPVLDHRPEPVQLDVAGVSALDEPREHAQADAVGRAAAGHALDHPAGADRLAVTGLEIAARDPVGEHYGWVSPGTLAGATATQIP